MYKVVQIQLFDKSAGSSALRLHNGLSKSDIYRSNGISLFKDDITNEGFEYLGKWPQLIAYANNFIERKFCRYDSSKFGLYSYPLIGTDISKLKLIRDADVIYIHWVLLGFFDFTSFENIFKLNKKVFIVMHDMWFMTGGCHHVMDCKLYKENCQACPIFPEDPSIASSQHVKKYKLISKYGNMLEFITPSLWLKNLALKSSLLKNQKIHFIPNYFDSHHFKVDSQNEARALLSIDPTKLVVCFGAVNISSIYKGWSFLKKAFIHLKEMFSYDQLEVVIFGNGDLDEFENSIDFKIHYLGFLKDENKIALAYKVSDVFVIPSILDNQPTTIVESMNCGVPVVGFNLCGIPEMIQHKKTGYIAEAYNSYDLANGIRYCLNHDLDVKLMDDYKPGNVLAAHYKLLNP
ncbi:glycosyltransferase [Algoriphagus antarcticus]|uniref:Glycosyltransferase involved in cell wall biosynthesis n=1 Tax=Algoriphagus antarcticus TaxID=238540 RepID=A0A3E0DI16_9BACT|nr:glycosyltransferase [Algoriphagus antarcticus]REG81413.1 glycosyltransferase involved in cell wall biosynthesis [Algoriphagus antarcticus]